MSDKTGLTYDTIPRPYDTYMERVDYGDLGGESALGGGPGSGDSGVAPESSVTGESLTDFWVETWIKSRNYAPKSRGFLLDGRRGYIECMELWVGDGGIIGGSLHIPDQDTTANSFHVETNGDTYWGCTQTNWNADNNNANAYVLSTGVAQFQSVTLTGSVIATDFQPGTDIAIQGWSSTLTFSATDADTVAWGAETIVLLDGTTYNISASNTDTRLTAASLTSPMNALTYIYLDINESTTELQATYTGSTAVGKGKILVCVAQNNSDTSSQATFQAFGGEGGQLVGVDYIAANSASVNEFVSNTAQIKDLIVTNAKINDLNVNKLTAGTISSQAIELGISAGTGDVAIAGGTYNAAAWTATNGFILGLDDSDSDREKFYIGNASSWLDWNVTTADTLTIAGTLTVGSLPNLPSDANLIGYWPLDEGSGTTANDYSANDNNGTITNGTWANGVSGKSLDFDGASGYVQITDDSTIQNIFDGGGSISCWINVDSDGEGDFGRIIAKGSDVWTIRVTGEAASKVKLDFVQDFSTTNGIWQSASTEVDLNTWTHVAVVYDSSGTGNNPIIYVNGDSVTISETSTPDGTYTTDAASDLYIGNESGDAATFDGTIDEIRLYSTELTANQVKALYADPAGGKKVDLSPKLPDDANLAGYWALDETAGTTAKDSTTNGNDGTITSGTYATGVSGTALDFDGSAGDVTITKDAAIDNIFDGGGSISVWINADSDGENNNGRIIDKGNIMKLWVNSETGGAMELAFGQQFSGDNYSCDTDSTDISINTWHHIVVTYDSSSVSNEAIIYIDGEAATISHNTPTGTYDDDSGDDLQIGNLGDTRTFDGTIDEVRFYSTILTAEEVLALYQNPSGTQHTTHFQDWGHASDITQIDGGNIRTETVTADKISAGTITSQVITLALTEAAGDVAIKSGKTDFGDDSTSGFILGIDDDDDNKAKFEIGSATTKNLKFDGTDLIIEGAVVRDASGYDVGTITGTGTTFYANISASADQRGLAVVGNNTSGTTNMVELNAKGNQQIINAYSTNNNHEQTLVDIYNQSNHANRTGGAIPQSVMRLWNASGATGRILTLAQHDDTPSLHIDHDASGDTIEIDVDDTSNTAMSGIDLAMNNNGTADMIGMIMNIANAGAGVEYAFEFAGSEYDAAAHGGTAAGRIKIKIGANTRYIYFYSD